MKNTVETTETMPLVALIGPTNAGKSTLFNRLTGSWQAITAKEESTTRDRVYGEVEWQGQAFTLIDTGGLVRDEDEIYPLIRKQMLLAIEEADLLLFVYDAAEGLDTKFKEFLDQLRGKKDLWLVANKVDTFHKEQKAERLKDKGLPYHEVSAANGRGCGDLLEEITNHYPYPKLPPNTQPMIALVGRPNVGKSTLLNALTTGERSVVSPEAGTTRDVVTAEITLGNRSFIIADTAGVRRRGQIVMGPEGFSVKRTLTAIAQADAVMVLVDASIGTTRGDLHLIYYARELGKPVLIVFNKCDLVDSHLVTYHRHAKNFDQIPISAINKIGLTDLTNWIENHV